MRRVTLYPSDRGRELRPPNTGVGGYLKSPRPRYTEASGPVPSGTSKEDHELPTNETPSDRRYTLQDVGIPAVRLPRPHPRGQESDRLEVGLRRRTVLSPGRAYRSVLPADRTCRSGQLPSWTLKYSRVPSRRQGNHTPHKHLSE